MNYPFKKRQGKAISFSFAKKLMYKFGEICYFESDISEGGKLSSSYWKIESRLGGGTKPYLFVYKYVLNQGSWVLMHSTPDLKEESICDKKGFWYRAVIKNNRGLKTKKKKKKISNYELLKKKKLSNLAETFKKDHDGILYNLEARKERRKSLNNKFEPVTILLPEKSEIKKVLNFNREYIIISLPCGGEISMVLPSPKNGTETIFKVKR